MIIGLLFLCESPRWYHLRGRREEATKALVWLRQLPADHPYVASELSDYERQMEHELSITSASGFRAIISESLNKKMAPRIIHGCLLMIFQNSTGINAMNNFSVTFFKVLGFHGSVSSPTAASHSSYPLSNRLYSLLDCSQRVYMALLRVLPRLSRSCSLSTGSAGELCSLQAQLFAHFRCTMLGHSPQ